MSVDEAILDALGLDPEYAKISSHGGSGFSSTFKLTATVDGKPKDYFIKTGSGADAEEMFKGEHASLNAIHDAVPNFCPKSHAHGEMKASGKFFLATDFLDLGMRSAGPGTGTSLAAKLAKLHTTAAPTPQGFDQPMFGFPVSTCCGETRQDNTWKKTWSEFYADNRLRHILAVSVANNGKDKELGDAVETVANAVVPRLLDGLEIVPVVVHGDLWSGNHSKGVIAGQGGLEEVVYDPSAVYGHSEYDLGIMNMFGGFGSSFWTAYHRLVPKAEPTDEFADRVMLYELYHHLNHFAMFGGGYRGGAMSIMRKLISKYA